MLQQSQAEAEAFVKEMKNLVVGETEARSGELAQALKEPDKKVDGTTPKDGQPGGKQNPAEGDP
jgi:hypothetical protein